MHEAAWDELQGWSETGCRYRLGWWCVLWLCGRLVVVVVVVMVCLVVVRVDGGGGARSSGLLVGGRRQHADRRLSCVREMACMQAVCLHQSAGLSFGCYHGTT